MNQTERNAGDWEQDYPSRGNWLADYLIPLKAFALAVSASLLWVVLLALSTVLQDPNDAPYRLGYIWLLIGCLLVLLIDGIASVHFVHNSVLVNAQLVIKRIFDVLFVSLFLAFFLPIMPLISWAIKLDTAGPALYRFTRMGQRGKLFSTYAYRTMTENQKPRRVTRVGRILRLTTLDQLPKLFNILEGDMSLVGPWPRRTEFALKTPEIDIILSVKPGMTGLAQVSDLEIFSQEWLALDIQYVENWSLLLDFRILIRTVLYVWQKHTRRGS